MAAGASGTFSRKPKGKDHVSTQTQTNTAQNGETNRPGYIAKQYCVVRVELGWKTRKERVGLGFKNDNGSICFRPSDTQLIEGDTISSRWTINPLDKHSVLPERSRPAASVGVFSLSIVSFKLAPVRRPLLS